MGGGHRESASTGINRTPVPCLGKNAWWRGRGGGGAGSHLHSNGQGEREKLLPDSAWWQSYQS